MKVCDAICMPVNLDKTFWATTRLTFLGLLIDTILQMVFIPIEKVIKAKEMIDSVLSNKSRKVTLQKLQKICGFLNFLGRCVVPGRAFTRRLYYYTATQNGKLKPHHHIRVNLDMKEDLQLWRTFLNHPTIFCRPFMDFSKILNAHEIEFYTDASGVIGLGGYCGSSWMAQRWDKKFLKEYNPSIEYLELFALVAGVLNWIDRFKNSRVVIFCDNQSVCAMINNNSTSCHNCMSLVRIFVLKCLIENVRVFAKFVKSKDNKIADLLSRDQIQHFHLFCDDKQMDRARTPVPAQIWPISKIWKQQ